MYLLYLITSKFLPHEEVGPERTYLSAHSVSKTTIKLKDRVGIAIKKEEGGEGSRVRESSLCGVLGVMLADDEGQS